MKSRVRIRLRSTIDRPYKIPTSLNRGLSYVLVICLVLSASLLYLFNPNETKAVGETHRRIDTFTSDGTWTAPTGITSVNVEAWGAGGGGSTNVGAGGGGGYSSSTVSVTPAQDYAVVVGTSATNTDGEDSTFNTTTVVAKGGLSGTNGGTGGQAAAGTGDTKYSGGDGSIGAFSNRFGGGGAGTTGDGGDGTNSVTGTGGDYFGGRGGWVGNSARDYGGGGGSQEANQRSGAQGLVRVSYDTTLEEGYPAIASRNWGRASSNTTSHSINLPSGVEVGDLLLVIFTNDGDATISASAGWTVLGQDTSGSDVRGAVLYKVATGSDSLTITTSASELSTHMSMRITGATGVPEATLANGSSTNSDPPSHTYSGGNGKHLWIATRHADLDTFAGLIVSAIPTSYSDMLYLSPQSQGAALEGADIASATRHREVATENPGTFTSVSEAWVASTIAVPGAILPTPGNSGTITSSTIRDTTLTLSWTKATDDSTAQADLEYQVYRSSTNNIDTVANAEANGTIIKSYTADISSFNVTGLTAETAYYFNVIVRDGGGNKAAYTQQTATTVLVLHNGILWTGDFLDSRSPTQDYSLPDYITSPPSVIPIDVGRQLFVDDFLIDSTTLTRSQHAAERMPDPVITDDGTDTTVYAMTFSDGVWYDPADKTFKMWYWGGPGNFPPPYLALATSTDGINWTKHAIAGSPAANTNTVLQYSPNRSDSSTVWMDLETATSTEKFKIMYYCGGTNQCVSYSADGISWTGQGFTIDSHSDRTTFFRNPFRGKWVESVRDSSAFGRIKAYAESDDLQNWTPDDPRDDVFWVGADENDVGYNGSADPPQLYSLEAVAYESLMLGMFSMYYDETGVDLVEIQAGFSRDGFQWERPTRGSGDSAFIRASNEEYSWDFANSQSAGGTVLVVGDELYFYHSARNTRHEVLATSTSVGLAKLRRDGFYSMDAGGTEGTLTTRPVSFDDGSYLFVNVDSDAGSLKAEVLDENGDVIAPFSKANSVAASLDSTIHQMTWSGGSDLSSLQGQTVKVKFYLTNGELYSFWVSPSTNGESNGYVGAGGPGFTTNTDTVGKVISSVASTPTQTSSGITWTTRLAGSSKVRYGLSTTYGNETTETDTSPRVTSHSVTLSSLKPCSNYKYQVISKDSSSNDYVSGVKSFTTTGCTGSGSVLNTSNSFITVGDTDSASFISNGSTRVSIATPINFTSSATQANLQIKQLEPNVTLSNLGHPSGKQLSRAHVYSFDLYNSVGSTISSFDESLTITITYIDADVSGLDTGTLAIYRYTGSGWQELSGCTVDTGNKQVTCTTTQFSVFALGGSVAASSSSGGGGSAPAGFFDAPASPAEGFKVLINQGAGETANRVVNLSLDYGSNIKNMSISNTGDFTDASLQPVQESLNWNLCSAQSGLVVYQSCPAGQKIVYVKYFTEFGNASEAVTATINYLPENNPTEPVPPISPGSPDDIPTNTLSLENGTVYLIRRNDKIPFTSLDAFNGLGYLLKYVNNTITNRSSSWPYALSSSNQMHPFGSWVLDQGTVYYVTEAGLVGIPTWEIFLANGGKPEFLVPANSADKVLPHLDVMFGGDSRVVY